MSAPQLSPETFAAVGEDARAFVYDKIALLCEASTGPDVVQAVLLGSLGAVFDAWVAMMDPGVSRADFLRAIVAATMDLAGQAFDREPADA